ncbi:ABC transporter ATP-binding protein [Candidatus Sumerlaeota bacterium]|nr:ABC transporter ATP-binding protein [Candidatus Sumerlaeota bacterium]
MPPEGFVIHCEGLTKVFHMHRSALRRLRAVLASHCIAGDHQLRALDHVSFTLMGGQSLGIVGPNGSGKSTLLKLLARILVPTDGVLRVHGKVASIIELGGGFHPEFTGRQNFFMNGSIVGFTRHELDGMFDRVVAFSGLGDFMELPIKTYSSGMLARLAFSIAIHMEPDILLVDEALAVGDAVFSHRCLARIHAMRERGVSLVLVTHDVNAIKQMCDEAMLLDQGMTIAHGTPDDVLLRYQTMVAERLTEIGLDGQTEFRKIGAVEIGHRRQSVRYGTFEAVIEGHTVAGEDGEPRLKFRSGERVSIEMLVVFHTDVENAVFGIMLRNRFGIEVFGTNTHLMRRREGPFRAGDRATVRFDLDLMLHDGTYAVSLAVHTVDGHFFDYQVEATHIEVMGPMDTIGVANLPMDLSVSRGGDPDSLDVQTPAPESGDQTSP